jgi:hypothetical protein
LFCSGGFEDGGLGSISGPVGVPEALKKLGNLIGELDGVVKDSSTGGSAQGLCGDGSGVRARGSTILGAEIFGAGINDS